MTKVTSGHDVGHSHIAHEPLMLRSISFIPKFNHSLTHSVCTPQETTMRKSLILAASLGTMLISSAAFAATMNATGVIKTIDAKSNSITLVDGKTYGLPAGFVIKNLKAGEKVSLVYDLKNNQMVATSVKAIY